MAGVTTGQEPGTRGRPRRRRRVVAGVVVVLVVLLLAGAWLALRVWQAAGALREARDLLSGIGADPVAAAAALDEVGDLTARAATSSSDPVWRTAEVLPWAGDQLEAVRVVATSLDDVVVAAAPAAAHLERLLADGGRDASGRVDVDALREAGGHVRDAADAVARAGARLDGLDPDRLVDAVAGPVRQAQDAVSRLDATLAPAAPVTQVLPGMLGADGPRTYLVLALNSAELRPPGGIVGTVVALEVDDGTVRVLGTRSTIDLPALDEPVLPVTAEESATWGDRLGRWVQNSVVTPSFPRTAELVAARWAQDVGGPVDGVVATDPVAVAALVGATGPVPDPDGGEIDGDRLVAALLRDAYVRHPDPAASDAYFAGVAHGVVAALGGGAGDGGAVLAAARTAVDERRVRVWSAHPGEQQVLAATVAGGAFTSGPFAAQPGVFLDDATQGKLGAFLSTRLEVTDLRCDGPSPGATVVLTLDHRPPADVAALPAYVTGRPPAGTPVGTLATTVSVWSAVGGGPLVVRQDGGPASGLVTTLDGRTVLQVPTVLPPGGATRIEVDVPLDDGAVTAWATPTVTSPGVVTARCPGPEARPAG